MAPLAVPPQMVEQMHALHPTLKPDKVKTLQGLIRAWRGRDDATAGVL